MINFRRAIRESFRYFPAVIMATICSLGIAFLWGSNISALYPVIDMTLKGESIQSGIQSSIAIYEKDRKTASDSLDQIVANQVDTPPSEADAKQIKHLERQISQAERSIRIRETLLSWANRWLPSDPFQTICVIMGFLFVSTFIKHVLMLTNDMLLGFAASGIIRDLRKRVFEKALSLDRSAYQRFGTSGLLATITASCDTLSAGLMALFGVLIREPLRVISCLLFASLISFKLLLLSAVLAPLLFLVVIFFNRSIRSITSSVLGQNVGFHEVLLEALNNVFTVQSFTMEKSENDRFDKCTRTMRRISLKLIFFTGLSKPLSELIGIGMVAIAVCAGAYLVVNQQTHIFFIHIRDTPLTVTDLLMFFGFLIGASDPLRKLSGVSVVIYGGAMAANMLYGVLDSEPNVKETETPTSLSGHQHPISIKNLSFFYHPDHPVLRDVNLEIPFGKTIAILGVNGSGKSTLINLLSRHYDSTTGSIEIGGVNIKDLALGDLRRRITLVSQNTELFNRTVMENILYGSPDATEADAIEAAKLAHADEFITKSLSNGYHTAVGQSGQNLSGGQRQRIALARAILRKPDILILDESTSQIDMASEIQIRETLESMKGMMTIIIITHREALTAIADDVYEMEHGVLRPLTRNYANAA